jgi:hypothetical protein
MHARTKEIEPKNKFKPFTIEIDVTNIDELRYLWNAFNASVTEVNESGLKSFDVDNITGKHFLWQKLDEKLNEI